MHYLIEVEVICLQVVVGSFSRTVGTVRYMSSPSTSADSSLPIIVGVSTAGAVVLAAAVGLAVVVAVRNARRGKLEVRHAASLSNDTGQQAVDNESSITSHWPSYDNWQFDRGQLAFDKILGEGQFGKVWLALATNIGETQGEQK